MHLFLLGYLILFEPNLQKCAMIKQFGIGFAVALSYSEQILDEGVIPMTSSDLPVDALVSPEGVIPISTTALNRYHWTNSSTFGIC